MGLEGLELELCSLAWLRRKKTRRWEQWGGQGNIWVKNKPLVIGQGTLVPSPVSTDTSVALLTLHQREVI